MEAAFKLYKIFRNIKWLVYDNTGCLFLYVSHSLYVVHVTNGVFL